MYMPFPSNHSTCTGVIKKKNTQEISWVFCTWLQFYESNGELIDAFFPELSPKDKKRL
jgi:hypothetical protein